MNEQQPVIYTIVNSFKPLDLMPIPREPKIKVSPYAKFDKFHHKKKKK